MDFESHPWRRLTDSGVTVDIAGEVNRLEDLLDLLRADADANALSAFLLRQPDHFSLRVVGPDFHFAAVDRVRSTPLFATIKQDKFFCDANPRTLRRSHRLDAENADGVLEFACGGYVTGGDTLVRSLYQLQAGEYWLARAGAPVSKHRYYRYQPSFEAQLKGPSAIQQLSDIIDVAFERLVARAAGREIWIPLSGGLDSRLVVAKLVAMKYPAIQTFSYGAPGNHEAKTAARVARQLSVPWRLVPGKVCERQAAALYHSEERRAYSDFADGLASTPSYLEFNALRTLKRSGKVPEDALFVNGQSADFLTGGHIREAWIAQPLPYEDLLDEIVDQHMALWPSLLTVENRERLKLRNRIHRYPKNVCADAFDTSARFESWEYHERQAKWVINGQRAYEFFGWEWALPLWSPELIDFFSTLCMEQKLNKNLYKNYLKQVNYGGVFDTFYDPVEVWPLRLRYIKWIARTIGLIRGRAAKEAFYKKKFYFGKYHHQYALFGRAYYQQYYQHARSVVSFTSKQLLAENHFSMEGYPG